MTGKRSYKERDNEDRFGKKRFLTRKIQEVEAEEEIKEFVNEDCTDECIPDRLDGQRPERC